MNGPEEMNMNEETNYAGPQRLPLFVMDGKQYFADLRLREFRTIDGPLKSIGFDSDQGRQLCLLTGIVTCGRCGMSVMISGFYRDRELCCMNCYHPL